MFTYFDSATVLSLRYPSRLSERSYCRRKNGTQGCEIGQGHQYDPNTPMIPTSSLEVRHSDAAENAGRGVYTLVDIPRDSYLGLDRMVHFVYVPTTAYSLIVSHSDYNIFWYGLERVWSYVHEYGICIQFRVRVVNI